MRVFKATQTIPYTSGVVKVFFEEVKAEAVKQVKRLRKENISKSVFAGFYDLTGSIKKGDYFVIEG